MDQIFENRLAFIKYLFQQGLEESNRSEPYSSICILSFHNSIELFLQLSAEYLQVDLSNVPFMEYWEKISIKMESAELPLRESIRKLNKARVALKHHGNFPSKLDIDAFKIYTNDFFFQATPLIFKINFEDVSMINYIYPEIAKEKVRLAYQLMNEGNLEGSIDKLATAFKDILNDYEKRMSDKFGRSPFRLSRNF